MALGRSGGILDAGYAGYLVRRGGGREEMMRICSLRGLLRRVGLRLIWGRVLGE